MNNFYSSISFQTTITKMLLALVFMFGLTQSSFAQSAEEGANIFSQNCKQCHKVEQRYVGPALKNVYDRRSEDWIISFVKNSQAVIASGDEYANELYAKFNNSVMPNQALSDDEVRSVIAYIKQETEAGASASAAGGAQGGTEGGSSNSESSGYNLSFFGVFGLVIVLLIVIVVLNRVTKVMERLLRQREGGKTMDDIIKEEEDTHLTKVAEKEAKKASLVKKLKSRKVVPLIILAVIGVLATSGWNALYKVGVQVNYQPTQPIAFSHQIHSGVNGIDCQYCHNGATKSKNASIPSANVCMNCHSYVKTESPEIAKIYKALDYDPDTRKYGPDVKPIEWIRIHNLPDFAYFNHSQHVTVAGIECQACHGPVEEMEEVYQFSNLTMGWCIECHRQTEVNFEGNEYYDNIIAAHDQVKNGEAITVANLGGLECSKCHY